MPATMRRNSWLLLTSQYGFNANLTSYDVYYVNYYVDQPIPPLLLFARCVAYQKIYVQFVH